MKENYFKAEYRKMASYSVRYSSDAPAQTFHRWPACRSKKWETARGTTLQRHGSTCSMFQTCISNSH